MRRTSRKELAKARGERRPVLFAKSASPLSWLLLLDCGHSRSFVANVQPKYVRCNQGCTAPNEDRVAEFKWNVS
jgi:hypothetical protein